ncbi:DNA cytosine methyltransferase [Mycolicibacterium brisbanense]|uniref:DNA (cytosine-5-)-methyltransferase n=1 Tax=Mycolicibacterium brisbanense TaxID=146020 RepID=A0A100W6V8_9MYCO|nr:DNA cytosine methyltransferase [Mycolicibacterium brisbanense]MCV7158013.1 DNA cytosine methyltransferase [Mycolicibacterium brisbanense]GAS92661.1 site-specific DNA methylase [Mycolicibacterium brisbanense]
MTLTLTDLFCGAGGSSTGAAMIPDVEVVVAGNHWQLAVDTHAENHPTTDHRCADLSQVDPRMFPTTDIAWLSPSCTKHSIAQGIKRTDKQPDLFGETLPDAAAERSRATMWDVVRFAEFHHYKAVIVENVVDVYYWPPFQAWLAAMESIGYAHRIVYLNSMHAQVFGEGAPQSRDRIYIVFWRKGNAAPALDRITRPYAVCATCGPVRAVQVWKQPDRAPWGRYRAQYVYRCPSVKCRNQIVEPTFRPAADIIDWSHLGQRIGDREKPLADKTIARIRAGIDRYWKPLLVPVEGRTGKQSAPVDQAARTMTTRAETGLAFIAELRGGGSKHRPVEDPLATVTASGTHHGLVTTYYGNGGIVPTGKALPTCTTVERHGLLMRNNTARGNPAQLVNPVSEYARTITTAGHQSLLTAERPTIDVDDVLFRMLEPREIARAMDFPADYTILGNRREQVRQAGNAVTPPAARDLVGVVAESLGVVA